MIVNNRHYPFAVLSHGDGSEATRCVQVSDDKGHGPFPASIQFGCFRGGQEESCKLIIYRKKWRILHSQCGYLVIFEDCTDENLCSRGVK